MVTHVVKRDGSIEKYSHNKLLSSIVAAGLSIRTPEGSAETTAQRVCLKTEVWLSSRPEVTSADIRRKAYQYLQSYNPDAAYIYKQHRSVL